MSLILWIFAYATILLLLRWAAGAALVTRWTKLLFLPGVLLSIVSRSVCCALSGTQLKSVNLFWREGHPVENEPPIVPVWADLLFATLPLLLASAIVLWAFGALGNPVRMEVELPVMEASLDALHVFVNTSITIVQAIAESARHVWLDDWQLFAWLYIATSLLLFAAPSVTEWKMLGWVVLGVCLFLSFFDYLGISPAFLSRGWFARILYANATFQSLARLVEVSLLAVIVFAAARGSWALGLAIARPRKGKKKPR